ncbi:MAG TPA: type II secretion system F family protein [Candidatus Dependentiae bacterium]|nr:type II secretion system F family protein [Candidatus Dependentiae bacterium]
MPYFKWRGVDITGTFRYGKLSARSPKHLDRLLFKRGIALLTSSPAYLFWFSRTIRLPLKIAWLRQLTVLIQSGVLLPDALTIVADQLNHPVLQDVVHVIAKSVRSGVPLHGAMQQQKGIVDPIVIQLIQVGQESGKLADALDAAVVYLEMEHDFYTKLRSALLMPLLAGLFLFGVTLIIFGVIVPRFVDIFASLGQDIPPLTQLMLRISLFVRSWRLLLCIGIIVLSCWLVKRYFKTPTGKGVHDRLLLRLPFIGTIIQQQLLAYTLQSLALLESSGIDIVLALRIVAHSIDNVVLKEQLDYLSYEVSSGKSLSEAMHSSAHSLFTDEVIAMVHIGQESGNISVLLERAAHVYREKVSRQLYLFSILLQPFLIIMLGVFVTILIFAVYVPMMDLAHVM